MKIHTGIYGGKSLFGGKESPLRAEEIVCENCEKCDLYKNKCCLRVTDGFADNYCKYGNVNKTQGYTSRAKKYYSFRHKYTIDDTYDKLSYPHKTLISKIGDYYLLKLPYCCINGGKLANNIFGSNMSFVKCEEFNIETIKKICEFKPQSMMGNVITDHQEKSVPELIFQIKNNYNELYRELIEKYPDLDVSPNHIGKKALLSTINVGEVMYKGCDSTFYETWYWDGEYLTYKNGYISKPNICRSFSIVEYKIKPNENTYIEITDNAQVNEKTIFKN
jgi:hypothetical protein